MAKTTTKYRIAYRVHDSMVTHLNNHQCVISHNAHQIMLGDRGSSSTQYLVENEADQSSKMGAIIIGSNQCLQDFKAMMIELIPVS